jgi:predicted O-methyltransferase YrrM
MWIVRRLIGRVVSRLRRAKPAADRPEVGPPETHHTFLRLHEELARIVEKTESCYSRTVLLRHAIEGSIKLRDAASLLHLLQGQKPARILEVGSFIGFSTRWMLEATRDFGSRVVSVDPNIRHRVFDNPGEILARFNAEFLNTRLVRKIGFFGEMSTPYYYDYETYSPLRTRAEVDALVSQRPVFNRHNLKEGPFDFIFIDGDHSARAVLNNFVEALPLLAPGGCIAFHDAVTWHEVNSSLGQIAREYGAQGSVEILDGGPWDFGCDGIGVFRRRAA